MITRIRIEAEADSIEQAKREIDILMGHAKLVALLEGIGWPDGGKMADEHYGAKTQDEFEKDGANSLVYKGRQVASFGYNKVEEGGLKQYGFKVLDTDQPSMVWDTSTSSPHGVFTYQPFTTTGALSSTTMTNFSTGVGGRDVTDEHIVLVRKNKASRAHTWEVVPSQRHRITVADGKVVEWESGALVEDVARDAADILELPEEETSWTLQLGDGAGAVINPQVKADDYLADGISVRPIPQNAKLMYGKLGGMIPLDIHNSK